MADKEEKFEEFRIISTRRLSEAMAEGRKNGERFCFILGSGASYKSGIPIGTELERTWMDEMNKTPGFDEVCKNAAALRDAGKLDYDFEKEILPKWKNGEKLGSEYYFDIYTLRFFPNHRNGYFKFENLFAKAKPSFGYNALVHILSDEKGSNLVITTNFDSLVEDALFIYTDKKPLVINHELLADYAEAPNVKRPIVAKVHRGLFFDPLNRKEETEKLKGNWAKVLESIFHVYTPVVIGYGGGDKSLMDLLEDKAVKMKNGIYWCYLENSGLPDERILKLISDKNGWLVKIKGFDAVMLALGNALVPDKIEPQSVRDYLKKQCDDRIYGYENHYSELMEESSVEDKSGKSKLESESEREFKEDTKELDKRVKDIEKSKFADELTALDYYRKGNRAALEEKDYNKAIDNYNVAIKLNPKYAEAYNNRGNAYVKLKEYDKALENYSKAIELDPDSIKAYNNRGNVYFLLKEYDKATENLSKAIELKPGNANTYRFRGNAYVCLKEYDKAIEDYSKAIELNPECEEAHYNRGNAYACLKEYDKAIEDYNMAIELNPEDAEAHYNRGNAYACLKEYDKAIEDYNMAIELNPEIANAYFSRGKAYACLKEYDKAIDDYSKVIELNPEIANAYYSRGNAYACLKEYDKAIDDYSKVIELNPEIANAYYSRGNAYVCLKEYDKAIDDYSKVIELNPEIANAYYSRGNVYVCLKEYDKAIDDYSKAIELNPGLAKAYNNRGNAYNFLKEYDKAIDDYSKAIELNPEDAEAYNNRGYDYLQLKEYGKAKTDIEKSLELDPDKGYTYDSLGELSLETGGYEEAAAQFTRAIELGYSEVETYEKRAKAYEALGETEKAEADIKMYEKLKAEQGDLDEDD